MKSLRLLVPGWLILASAASVSAQVVTFEPAFPSVDSPVTLYFHADKGAGGLKGYTGEVYAHTGVITDRSAGPSDWKYVKTAWGTNTPDTRLERIGADLYRLRIENVRQYYGVPASEAIEQLAFVFRSAQPINGAYLEGKESGGKDIFIPLYKGGVVVRFTNPVATRLQPFIANRDTTVTLMAVAQAVTGIQKLELYLNQSLVKTVADDTLRYDLSLMAPGTYKALVVAHAAGGVRDTASASLVRNRASVLASRPSGLKDGITVNPADPTRATLSLFAPRKSYVYVVGDFNDWEVRPEYQLNKDSLKADSVWYWITLTNLQPGREYAFQYLVDGRLRVADPYAEKVLHPEDAFIGSQTYPGLKAYPQEVTEHYVSVLSTGAASYNWQLPDFDAPEPADLVIYELLLRDFLAAHDYRTLTDTLNYLQRLGVNAIELMPITEFDGNLSWGYNPAFYLAPDKYYGPARDLKRFIDEAHSRGIAVILDVVYNHLSGSSPLVRLYSSGAFGPPTPQNPWANVTARHPFSVFNDLNHESAALQYHIDRANAFWLTEFNIDGFRFDLSKGFTQTNTGGDVGAWSRYDASRIRLIKRMADRIWAVNPDAYVILEHFADTREEKELSEYGLDRGFPGMLLWNNMNRAYSQAAMGYLSDPNLSSDLSNVYYRNRGFTVPHLISYMESHDEQWLMYRNLAYGPTREEYDVRSLPVALDRMKLAGAFFFLVPGPKMIWQFGELGYGYGPDGRDCLRSGDGPGECPAGAPDRTGVKPVRWEYRRDPLRMKLYKTWSALLDLRNRYEVFRSPETTVTMDVGQGRPVRWIRLVHPTMNVVVIGNFDVVPQSAVPPLPSEGVWYRYFEGDSITVRNLNAPVALLPGEFHIYTSLPVVSPEAGLITVDADKPIAGLPERFRLEQNYPNPFNPATSITYGVSTSGPVRLEVFDVLGRRVAVLVDHEQTPGLYTVSFSGEARASGLYFYRLESAGKVVTKTMTLLK